MEKYFIAFPLSNNSQALTTTTYLGNMAYQVDDGKDVKKHRLLLAELLHIPYERFTFVHQTHSDRILEVTVKDLGKGVNAFEDGLESDALYTKEKEAPLCIFHADCVPIFFVCEKIPLVGIIHAGFKGTMKHITYKVIKEVMEKEGLTPLDFQFYIGPYRSLASFPIDEMTKQEIKAANLLDAIKGDHFDNGLANRLDLYKLGILDSQIQDDGLDTLRDDVFYSAYQKTPAGRMVSLIYLK